MAYSAGNDNSLGTGEDQGIENFHERNTLHGKLI